MKPSPYVSIYISRKQAQDALAALRWMAEGRAKSNPLWRCIAVFEKARDDANCAGINQDVFFPPQYENATEAKRICAACVVRDDCLEYALAHNLQHGIWGGKGLLQRRTLRLNRLRAAS